MDLVDFIRARLDEDERIARDADGISRDTLLDLYEDLIQSRPLDGQRRLFGIFIGRFTSGRMLADIQAKRRLVDWHTDQHDLLASARPTVGCRCYDGWPCTTLRLLALPYASHHEYRTEWRP
ncbi:DUF6221 family protein [Nonomuraea sp. NPDC049400]|uniref:DUF6221 family protein n=1 Tax=Nonomuraea sp. NPDC049400 TaxID=3364352 RepID=UPI0037BE0D36